MNILVVDDFPDAAASLSLFLQLAGHDARPAGTPKQAAEIIKSEAFTPDALLLDIALPDVDGYRLAVELCSALPKRPLLIAMTGYINLESRSRTEGFDHHFVKPADTGKLLSLLCERTPNGTA
jgi:DNA-binding response OmpR family regulator